MFTYIYIYTHIFTCLKGHKKKSTDGSTIISFTFFQIIMFGNFTDFLGANLDSIHMRVAVPDMYPYPNLSNFQIPPRFAEWSSACWELQRDYLLGSNTSLDVRFLGLYHSQDVPHLNTSTDCMVGRAMAQWWDQCEEAGSRSRDATTFQEDPPTLEVLNICREQGTLSNLTFNSNLFLVPNREPPL